MLQYSFWHCVVSFFYYFCFAAFTAHFRGSFGSKNTHIKRRSDSIRNDNNAPTQIHSQSEQRKRSNKWWKRTVCGRAHDELNMIDTAHQRPVSCCATCFLIVSFCVVFFFFASQVGCFARMAMIWQRFWRRQANLGKTMLVNVVFTLTGCNSANRSTCEQAHFMFHSTRFGTHFVACRTHKS